MSLTARIRALSSLEQFYDHGQADTGENAF